MGDEVLPNALPAPAPENAAAARPPAVRRSILLLRLMAAPFALIALFAPLALLGGAGGAWLVVALGAAVPAVLGYVAARRLAARADGAWRTGRAAHLTFALAGALLWGGFALNEPESIIPNARNYEISLQLILILLLSAWHVYAAYDLQREETRRWSEPSPTSRA